MSDSYPPDAAVMNWSPSRHARAVLQSLIAED